MATATSRATEAERRRRKNLDELGANMLAGALCTSFSVAVWNPLDTLRIRWQVLAASERAAHGGLVDFARTVVAREGLVRGLWTPGCVAHSTSVFLSSGIRLGFYPTLRDAFAGEGGKHAGHMWLAGFSAGAVGFFLANPLFQAKVRLQATAGLGARAPYASMTACVAHMAREEGVAGLWRGSSAMVARGALLSAGAGLGYDFTKTEAKRRGVLGDGPALHALASVASALLASVMCAPCDLVMTRYQAAPALGISYKGLGDCVKHIVRTNGVPEFYRGWTPLFLRLCPLWMMNMPLYEFARERMGVGYMD